MVLYNRFLNEESNYQLALRPSMNKFKSNHYEFEIVTTSNFISCYLNRQIIQLLSSLGVADNVFIQLQNEMLQNLNRITTHPTDALSFLLQTNSSLNKSLIQLIEAGFPLTEPFLNATLESMKAKYLQELRRRSRIIVKDGCVLLGGMDETLTLDYGECFVQITDPTTNELKVIEGPVVVTRSPCLHPGDIRKLVAVRNKQMEEDFVDVIIFPGKGPCPHPFEMSNGDLDGDIFFISWNTDLIPPQIYRVAPSAHTNVKKHTAGVTPDLIKQFYTDYMKNDTLGSICNAHAATADESALGALNTKCLCLAELAAIAVDFPKSGIPVVLPKELIPEAYPSYMEYRNRPSYESTKVIGKLYASVMAEIEKASYTSEVAFSMDSSLIYDEFVCENLSESTQTFLAEQYYIYAAYNHEIEALMLQFNMHSESDLFVGKTETADIDKKKKERLDQGKEFDSQAKLNQLLLAILAKYRSLFWLDLDLPDPSLSSLFRASPSPSIPISPLNHQPNNIHHLHEFMRSLVTRKASAWYFIAYSAPIKEPHLLSFPWVVHDVLCYMKQSHFKQLCTLYS